MKKLVLFAAFGCLMVLLCSCGASPKSEIGLVNNSLRSCPNSPNCVSSFAAETTQQVDPFYLQASFIDAWTAVKTAVLKQPNTRIVTSTEDYLHLECRSAVFGFVDDLELQLLPKQNQIAVRSAARSGYYDFGVNRARVEELQRQLRAAGVIR